MSRAAALALAALCWVSAGPAAAFGPDLEALRRLHAEPGRAITVTPDTGTTPPEQRDEAPRRAEVELPKILSDEDVAHYRRIFALQTEGRFRLADAVIERLSDRRLVGYVLAHRYLSPGYRTDYRELREWLEDYADNQIAVDVHGLAMRRRPRGAARPRSPQGIVREPAIATVSESRALPRPRWSRRQARAARVWTRRIERNLARDRLTITGRLLARNDIGNLFGPARIDEFRASLALQWFRLGRLEQAYSIAQAAAERSGELVPEAHWAAGITAWALERYEDAARHFEGVVTSERGEDTLKAGGAYWAARAHLALDQPDRAREWLTRGAQWPRNFYGVMARHRLGMDQDFGWEPEEADPEVMARLREDPGAQRAFALIQVGRYHAAGQELLRLFYRGGEAHRTTFVAIADAANLPQLGFRIGVRAYLRDRSKLDTGLYPIPGWRPEEGFEIDRAVIYAIMRQESAFNARARSHAGARGLMQLMPATAADVARDRSLRRREVTRLYDPRFNMTLGQRFLLYLVNRPRIRGNLFFVFAAYNAGEGNLNRWQMRSDPLLFVESIPLWETREYVKRVMYNLWAYRMRLGQATPSLDAVTAGRWPHYRPLDADQ